MTKKNYFFAVILLLSASPFFASFSYLFEDYFASANKCLRAFDENYREQCMWGSVETLKNALNQSSERSKKNLFKIYYCGFFRNEGKRILSVNDPFSVESSGEYIVTILNGDPSEKRSKAKVVKLSILREKTSERIFDEAEFRNQEKISVKIKLEKGKIYTLIPENLEPIPAYITVIISNKPIE
ncbi:MAG: hypothetical protein N2445_07005 [Acidobacteria bacterium]|nr:hypothetical protein [Acidobacteriota bacterium]